MPKPTGKKAPVKKQLTSEDPDSWLRKLHTPDAIKKWRATEVDFISDYMVNICSAAGKGPKGVSDQVKRMGELLELIPDDITRNCYYSEVGAAWPAFKKNYKLAKRDVPTTLPKLQELKKEDKSDYFDFGFWEQDGAYYTFGNGQQKIRMCNFTIQILYFVYSENQPKYVCIFKNLFGRTRISAITTDDFTTVGTFRKVIGRLGNFVFEGTDSHLNKIKLRLFHGVREAEEPKFMGYNTSGNFYTWANGLYYNGEFYRNDKYGMVQLKHPIKTMEEFKSLPAESQVMFGEDLHVMENPERFIEKNGEDVVSQYIAQNQANHLSFYFLPWSTRFKITENDDDDFEFERKFKHSMHKEPLTFQTWAELMQKVYHANGRVAVAYYNMALYRDIVYKHNNNYIPMLGFFGPRGSGKSTCARSLNKMFGEGLPDGVNLESGSTATGVRRYLASMQNAILWLNEYKNSLPEYTLGMIKGISDGSGKLTGRNTGGNETKTYTPRCAVVISGQDLPTKDPAIFHRMIPCEFDDKNRDREAYETLTALEKDNCGSAVTCEMLNHRPRVKAAYAIMEPMMTKRIREKAEQMIGQKIDDRLALNLSSLLTTFLIVAAPQVDQNFETAEEEFEALCTAPASTYLVNFGFDLKTLANDLMRKVNAQIEVQHTSDDVEQYFNVLQNLIEQRKVVEGHHYKITKGSDNVKRLFLRIAPIHVEYMSAAQRAGMAAMDQGTLRSYMKKHRTFLEERKDGVDFEHVSNRTSAYVFDYDKLLGQGIEFKVGQSYGSMMVAD